MQRPFEVYNDITGRVVSYAISYSDSASGAIFSSNIVNATSCEDRVCSDEFDIESSLCTPSSDINVTISATTNLGEGPESNPVKEGV